MVAPFLSGIAFSCFHKRPANQKAEVTLPTRLVSSVCLCSFFLKLLVHGQCDLWRNVNESLTQQKAHRPGGVVEKPVQLLNRALLTILFTEAQNQLLNLLSTRGTLESKEKAHSITGYQPQEKT